MNFKSKGAYQNYLGYIYANNLNKPGGAPVSIAGKPHKVDRSDQYGGFLLANGGSFSNPGFQALPKEVQNKIRANAFADGGPLDQLTEFNAGGSHEQNPLGGIPQGMGLNGQPNLVEQGETKLNAEDYIFSDRLTISKSIADQFQLAKNFIGKTFAAASKKFDKPNSFRDKEYDEITKKSITQNLDKLMVAQEAFKAEEAAKKVEEALALDPNALANMGQPMGQPPMGPEGMVPQSAMMGMPQGQPIDPNQMPPEMLAQMPEAQQGAQIVAYGGHMYRCGGKMYDFGGAMRNVGAGAYGVGEGMLDTLTFGLTDPLTDKGFDKLSQMGNRTPQELEREKMLRGFGNTAGAITGGIVSGGAALGSAISEGSEGLAAGASNIKGTNQKFDNIANSIGQVGSMAGSFIGGNPEAAANAPQFAQTLMKAKDNPMLTRGVSMASNFMAGGGHMYPQLTPTWANNAGPMGQPLTNLYDNGGPLSLQEFLAQKAKVPEGTTPEEAGALFQEFQQRRNDYIKEYDDYLSQYLRTAPNSMKVSSTPTLSGGEIIPSNIQTPSIAEAYMKNFEVPDFPPPVPTDAELAAGEDLISDEERTAAAINNAKNAYPINMPTIGAPSAMTAQGTVGNYLNQGANATSEEVPNLNISTPFTLPAATLPGMPKAKSARETMSDYLNQGLDMSFQNIPQTSNIPSFLQDANQDGLPDDVDTEEQLRLLEEALQDPANADNFQALSDEYLSALQRYNTEQSDKNINTKLGLSNAEAAAMLAPIGYNLAMGIAKPTQLNAADYMVKTNLKAPTLNINPSLAEASSTFAQGVNAARNAAPGAGSYLTNLSQLGNVRNQTYGDLYTQKENYDNQMRYTTDVANKELEKSNLSQKFAVDDYNIRSKADRLNMLAKAAEQTAALGKTSADTRGTLGLMKAVAPSYAPDIRFMLGNKELYKDKTKED